MFHVIDELYLFIINNSKKLLLDSYSFQWRRADHLETKKSSQKLTSLMPEATRSIVSLVKVA